MSDCQLYLDNQLDAIIKTIDQTELTDREHAFAFGEKPGERTPIILGDCDDVPRPTMPSMIGTVHSHTIDYSHFSEGDLNTFLHSQDRVMCYLVPKEGIWKAKCIDRELGVCGEAEIVK